MTTLTVSIKNKKQAQMLYEMLSAMKFVKEVAVDEEYELSAAVKKILDMRLAQHRKNPQSGISPEELVRKISGKHGFKNHR